MFQLMQSAEAGAATVNALSLRLAVCTVTVDELDASAERRIPPSM